MMKHVSKTGKGTKHGSKLLAPLRRFFFQHGHPHVPNLPEYEDVFELSNRLRQSKNRLAKDVINELDSFGFIWNMASINELRWYYHYDELKKFFAEFGHTRISAKRGDYKVLGGWVTRQRRNKKTLSSKQIKMLEAAGLKWTAQIQEQKKKRWMLMYAKLEKFYAKYGHSNVPDRFKKDEQLGRWVSTNRYSEKILKPWQLRLLKQVGFKYKVDIQKDKAKHREGLFKRLRSFYKKYGHANVPEGFSDHKLHLFVSYLRQHPERVSAGEKRELKKIKFSFSDELKKQRDKVWLKSFEAVKKFKVVYGHCKVPSTYVDEKLARWVGKQRRLYKAGTLPENRKALLCSVGFYFGKRRGAT
jgi:hypothetical protein